MLNFFMQIFSKYVVILKNMLLGLPNFNLIKTTTPGTVVADAGEARGCFTNTVVIHSVIELVLL